MQASIGRGQITFHDPSASCWRSTRLAVQAVSQQIP